MNTELDYLERIAIALERIANVMDKFNETAIKAKQKEEFEVDDGNIHQNAWVLSPHDTCLTSMPPKWQTTIYHYYDPEGLNIGLMNKREGSRIFFTKEEAEEYCRSIGGTWTFVDIPTPDKIIINYDEGEEE